MRCGSPNKPAEDSPFKFGKGDDSWRSEPNGDRTCSFCGSLHPDDAIKHLKRYVETGGKEGRFSTTSKTYKVYVNGPNVKNAAEGGIKFYVWHADDEQLKTLNGLIPQASKIMWEKLR